MLPEKKKTRVLIVDDSAVVRQMVTRILNDDPDLEVVGSAPDPYFARDKILELKPDVLTLDIEMPRMDGLTFLKILMEHHPIPVVVMSSLSQAGSEVAMEALGLGAVDVLGKPDGSFSVGDLGPQLVQKVKAAALSRRLPRKPASTPAAPNKKGATPTGKVTPVPTRPGTSIVSPLRPAAPVTHDDEPPHKYHPRQIVLLGASTGGTEALKDVLTALPADMPGICVVQHIPAYFSGAFARRLDSLCALRVKEAVDGDKVEPGLVLVAPGNFHMVLSWTGGAYRVSLKQGPMVWHQRPAVDVLFKSAADLAKGFAVGAVMTGMGKDGAEGLLMLKQRGARTFAQSEETCVVYGMPKACFELGAAERMVPLPRMADAVLQAVRQIETSPPAP